jgi:hypothetical protein
MAFSCKLPFFYSYIQRHSNCELFCGSISDNRDRGGLQDDRGGQYAWCCNYLPILDRMYSEIEMSCPVLKGKSLQIIKLHECVFILQLTTLKLTTRKIYVQKIKASKNAKGESDIEGAIAWTKD